jgi:hypothetical protein
MRVIFAFPAALFLASAGCSHSARPRPADPAPAESLSPHIPATARVGSRDDAAEPDPRHVESTPPAGPKIRFASLQSPPAPQGAVPAEPAEEAVRRVSEAIERKQDLLAQAQERLDAALGAQGPSYSTPAEAQTAQAMLELATLLHAKNAATLAGYRDVFRLRRELKGDFEALPEHCGRLATQYERWADECPISSLKLNYQALADLYKARATESASDAKELLADYDPKTEEFLAEWSLFLGRLKTSLEQYPARRLDQALRTQVLGDLARHVAALDDLSASIRKWSDVSRAQASGGRAPRTPADPGRGDGGSYPGPGPRDGRPSPHAEPPVAAVRQAALRVQGPAGAGPDIDRLEDAVLESLASRSRRLNSIAPADVPALAARYGSVDGRIPFYSLRALHDGDADVIPAGHAFVTCTAMRRVVMVYEEAPPGIPASSVPGDLILIERAGVEEVAAATRRLANARRVASVGSATPRVASARP